MKTAVHALLGLVLVLAASPALADTSYAEWQARALEEAARHELEDDHDQAGQKIFLDLAAKARSTGPVTIADLSDDMRNWVRNGRRDTHEARDHVALVRIEAILAGLSPMTRQANAEKVAHAEVDTFVARRELSEPRPWKTCAGDFLDHAAADLANLIGDRDGDGIPDTIDQCPDQPEDKDGFEDADGCPDPDNDRDGILDANDRCPNEPEDRDGWQDADGCPDPDNDGDGILDVNDACPNDPETMNGVADEDGCPDGFLPVYFESDKSNLDAADIEVLGKNAELLKATPSLRLRVEGNCDSENSDDYNYRLGHARAKSVKDYMVTYLGVSAERLDTESNGEKRPAADNASREGRAMNRRAEFVVIVQ